MYSAVYTTYTEQVIDQVYADQREVEFAGQTINLCTGLEIAGSDDGIEYLISCIESGDEYGVVCANMTKAQMQMCVDASNEMYAQHCADLIVSDADKAAAEYNFWF